MKKILSLSLVLLLSLCLITGCGKKKTDGNPENTTQQGNVNVNTNDDVVGDKEVEVFKFENTSLVYDNGMSRLETKVTNTSDQEQTLSQFRIHVMKDDVEIANLPGYIGNTLKPGESRILTTTYGDDLTVATLINYEIVR